MKSYLLSMSLLTGIVVGGPERQVRAVSAGKDGPAMKILRTPGGVRFGLFGDKPKKPAPTLFVFATGLEDLERQPVYTEIGRRLAPHGFLHVALDPPCHGEDIKPGEPSGLVGWRHRLEKGDALVADFTARASAVLDHLIKEGYTDQGKVAACGVSRGGFLAFHLAATDKRIAAAIGFAPVTNLLALSEFKGMEKHEPTRALNLVRVAPKLAGRPIWISIGNHDERVNTDDAIAFTRQVVTATAAKQKDKAIPVELHVGGSLGHRDLPGSHERAAAWLLQQVGIGGNK